MNGLRCLPFLCLPTQCTPSPPCRRWHPAATDFSSTLWGGEQRQANEDEEVSLNFNHCIKWFNSPANGIHLLRNNTGGGEKVHNKLTPHCHCIINYNDNTIIHKRRRRGRVFNSLLLDELRHLLWRNGLLLHLKNKWSPKYKNQSITKLNEYLLGENDKNAIFRKIFLFTTNSHVIVVPRV